MSSSLITVRTFPSRFEAELAKLALESVGIKSFVSADDAGGMRPAPFAYSIGAELIVRQTDMQKATDALKEAGI